MSKELDITENVRLLVKNQENVFISKIEGTIFQWNLNHSQFRYASHITHITDPLVERTLGDPGEG